MNYCIRQRGNTLVIILLLMPVTVIFSMSMLADVISQKKMAGNLQQKTVSSISAQSTVDWKWNMEGLLGAANEKVQETRETELNDEFSMAGSDLDAKVTVCYQGEISLPTETELNIDQSANAYRLAQHVFIVTGEATELVTGAYSRIRQGGYVIRPGTGIAGEDCS